MKKAIAATMVVVLCGFFSLGCSGMSSTQQSTLSGGAIGAGAGAGISALSGGSVLTGTAIGAAAGAIGGLLVDQNRKNKKPAPRARPQAGRDS